MERAGKPLFLQGVRYSVVEAAGRVPDGPAAS